MLSLPDERWTAYRARIRDEHAAGWLTRTHRDVLIAIANLNAAGEWEPTVAKIALDAACDPRTVRRARERAVERGLLAVQAQFERGWQRTNRYELSLPTTPCQPKPKTSKGGRRDRPIRQKIERKQLNKGVDLLAARVEAFRAQQIAALGLTAPPRP
jgi:hypothetical protein